MRRNSLVCRLGTDDDADISLIQTDSLISQVNFCTARQRLDFGLGRALDVLRQSGFQPNETALDLTILASIIYLADTRINRTYNSQEGWTREIDLYVPVTKPEKWTSVTSLLTTMINFLTGDRWRIFFRERQSRFKTIIKEPKQQLKLLPSCVCLLSGGLDSFIGAIDLLAAGERPVFVSHYWDGVTSDIQTKCLKLLGNRFGQNSHWSIRARIGFPIETLSRAEIEPTQRSRSFLFFALGTLTGSSLKQPTVIHVPENGFISLNVPLDPLRLGALSTRTTHPFFMARWNDLLSLLELPLNLQNNYRHKTKGQMVASCADIEFLKAHAKHTMSCSSPAKARWAGTSQRHCGYCVPCIIRRAGLIAGLGVDDTLYSIDNLHGESLDSTKSVGEHVRSFQVALKRIAKSPSDARFLIHTPGPLTDIPSEIVQWKKVYLDGLEEVAKLLHGVKARPL